jgi:hypothetical protein
MLTGFPRERKTGLRKCGAGLDAISPGLSKGKTNREFLARWAPPHLARNNPDTLDLHAGMRLQREHGVRDGEDVIRSQF